ncbi:hypothetical protein HPP92_025534 [Vanilla planifolia]|uniref:Uncharacterized protein n=1 Tax=Vanilla planifolia TaxID=51239 RepID=A0A835PKT1_VANPL|nr:hypothetical protein HPP92_025534 [Vanilla planifolia]
MPMNFEKKESIAITLIGDPNVSNMMSKLLNLGMLLSPILNACCIDLSLMAKPNRENDGLMLGGFAFLCSFAMSELEIEPRYPLFGGWKKSLRGQVLSNTYELKDPRVFDWSFGLRHWFEEDGMEVALPEGSKSPAAAFSFPADQYLEVYYSFSPICMLAEPLMLVELQIEVLF